MSERDIGINYKGARIVHILHQLRGLYYFCNALAHRALSPPTHATDLFIAQSINQPVNGLVACFI